MAVAFKPFEGPQTVRSAPPRIFVIIGPITKNACTWRISVLFPARKVAYGLGNKNLNHKMYRVLRLIGPLVSPRPAKKKSKRKARSERARRNVTATSAASRKRPTAKKKMGVTAKMAEMELLPAAENPAQLIPAATRKSLAAWFELYMKLEGSANADATW